MGLFAKIKQGLKKTKDALINKLNAVFRGGDIDADFYDDLEFALINSDMGAATSQEIIARLKDVVREKHIFKQEKAREELKDILKDILSDCPTQEYEYPLIITVVGVNGVGKTTTIGKLANYFKQKKKSVTLVAGDTFRAAATEQLTEWAKRVDVKIVKHQEGADASAVVYDGIASAKAKKTDVLLIDTAGRLHNKENLMHELGKIDRVITREYPEAKRYNLIVLDATTGQNALSQIEEFNKQVKLDGIVLTKLDGTAKGGIIISIMREYNLPVYFVGVGEGIDDLEPFNAKDFAENLF